MIIRSGLRAGRRRARFARALAAALALPVGVAFATPAQAAPTTPQPTSPPSAAPAHAKPAPTKPRPKGPRSSTSTRPKLAPAKPTNPRPAAPAQKTTATPAGPTAATPQSTATAQAKAAGKPVTVDSERSPYADTVANPDGSFTRTIDLQPRHAWNGKAWVTPDATLHVNANGTVAPTASVSGLTLSGGGTGPLAVFDDGSGHSMSVTMPMRLPRPTISGDTATYPNVLPGVDLEVTATVQGGIAEVLVVHDATAAANPALASLTLATEAHNLTLSTDPASGATVANDATGTAVFSAPPPVMWDSTTSTTAQPRALSQAASPDPLEAPPATAGHHRPGAAAHITPIPVRASSHSLTLTPPAAALTGPDVHYPLYVDPAIAPTTNPRAYVESWHPNTTAYNPTDDLRTGFDDWPASWQNGITRSFLRFDGLGAVAGKAIVEAHLQLQELRASCSGDYTLIVHDTGNWGSNLTWNNQPGYGAKSSSITVNGAGGYQVGLTDMTNYALGNGWSGINMVMHMSTESNDCAYRHWTLNPSLVITYWSTPNQPQSLTETNGTQTYPCNTSSPGTWIPAAANNQVQLNFTISSPDVGYDLYGNAWVSTNGGSYADYQTTRVSPYNGGNYAINDTMTLADGSHYAWYAQDDNTVRWSPPSPTCYFRYDATAPDAPTVSTSDYPASGPTAVTSGGSGTFTLSANDGGPNPSGVASFTYWLDDGSAQTLTATGGQATLSVPLSALHWGTNTLDVQTTDVAGNMSQDMYYDFYVQQSAFGAYSPGTAGDVDGDNNPDLVTVDAAGNVRMFSHPDTVSVDPTGNTTVDPLQYGGKVIIPAHLDTLWPGGTFAGALISHAGSFSGNNADDLLIVQNGNLAVARNHYANGTTWDIGTNIAKPACGGCANYDGDDWSSVTQMIAVPTTPGGRPDMLTVELWNGVTQLWLYTPTATGTAGFNAPTLISSDSATWHWAQAQLIGAGQLPGLSQISLIYRNNSDGNVYLIPNITAGISGDPSSVSQVAGYYFPVDEYPMVTTIGRADSQGNWPIWETMTDGSLDVATMHTDSNGVTDYADGGYDNQISNYDWANHEVALGATYTPPDRVGMIDDGSTTSDSVYGPYAYSAQALANATVASDWTSGCLWATCASGVAPGQMLSGPNNDLFALPPGPAGTYNVWQANGQILPAPPDSNGNFAGHISFLGSATTGSAGESDTVTVTYTDGHTQQIPITLSDWTLDNNAWPVAGGNSIVATSAHRDVSSDGSSDPNNAYLYATADAQLLDNGKTLDAAQQQIASITLPWDSSIAIFAIAVS